MCTLQHCHYNTAWTRTRPLQQLLHKPCPSLRSLSRTCKGFIRRNRTGLGPGTRAYSLLFSKRASVRRQLSQRNFISQLTKCCYTSAYILTNSKIYVYYIMRLKKYCSINSVGCCDPVSQPSQAVQLPRQPGSRTINESSQFQVV